MASIATILGITDWCFNFLGILIFLLIFIIIIIKCRRKLHDISLVLTLNSCIASIFTCLTICIMICSNLTTGFLTFDHKFCIFWGLLHDEFTCAIYYSYCLHGIYRLCRVVFYKNKVLVVYSLYIKLIFCQWLLTILILLPPVFLNWYTKISTENYCLVPYTNLVAETYHIIVIYLIPLICIAIIYIRITTFIRNSSHVSLFILEKRQRHRNMRDLTVLKRIIILMLILTSLRLPATVFMIYDTIIGHLYPYTFSIVGLITSICLIFVALLTIHITPQLRKNIFIFHNRRNNQINVQVIPQPDLPMNTHIETIQ
ncbi:unnamed protein product [Adineta steineri]|uniref:G-protein coupled receptors family 1 profile domain-containing protein n=1 Tax=Adineta steineri TaxID=433720 RepID=A0A814AZ48_9BILA|nr:unnamed protein product [Adineta steineri]CAF1202006.1 unnamed protein product [Adineta steineri]